MSHYKSNLRDIEFNLFEVFGAQDRLGHGPFADLDVETARRLTITVDFAAGGMGCPVRFDHAVFEK